MKSIFLFLIVLGICANAQAQVELLLLAKDSLVSKMQSNRRWEFSKQSEEFINGVSYDLYEYVARTKGEGELTFLFDKNGICTRVIFVNTLSNSGKLAAWADQNFKRSGENVWADYETGKTTQGTLKKNESAATAWIEFVNLLYKPAL